LDSDRVMVALGYHGDAFTAPRFSPTFEPSKARSSKRLSGWAGGERAA